MKILSLSSHENKRRYFPVHQIPSQVASQFILPSDSLSGSQKGTRLQQDMDVSMPTSGNASSVQDEQHQSSANRIAGHDDANETMIRDKNHVSESQTTKNGMADDKTPTHRDSADSVQAESLHRKDVLRSKDGSGALPRSALRYSAPKSKSSKKVSFRCFGDPTSDYENNHRSHEKKNENSKQTAETPKIVGQNDSFINAKCAERRDRVQKVGSHIWDMVKNLNPAFKVHCTRKLSKSEEKTDSLSALATSGDDQLLETKNDRDTQGKDLFEVLCNFQELLSFLGFKSLRDVPVELVRSPRSQALRPSLMEMIEASMSGVGVRHMRQEGSEMHEVAHSGAGADEDAKGDVYGHGHGDDVDNGNDNDDDCDERKSDAIKENDVQVGSMLLNELGFSESIVTVQVFVYLKTCRWLTHQCSEASRRMVQTRERSITGG